jgi:acyl-CoA thioesterase I
MRLMSFKWASSLERRGALLAAALVVALIPAAAAVAGPIRIVGLGDSLMAGYQLPPGDSFPEVLEKALRAKGYDVTVANAGVSGDTTSDGLQRLDWSVPAGTDAVILELGANDALRGIDPRTTEANLEAIIADLKKRGIATVLAGMLAPPNMGADYTQAFDAIYPRLAEKYGLVFYPFFLDRVAAKTQLLLPDGMHPNPQGVDAMVAGFLPTAETLIRKLGAGGPIASCDGKGASGAEQSACPAR